MAENSQPATLPDANRAIQLASGALAATTVLFLIAIVPLRALDQSLTIALYAFAAALPLLIFSFTLSSRSRRVNPGGIPGALGSIGVVVGISAALWHAAALAGVVFAAISLVCFVISVILGVNYADTPKTDVS